MEHIVKSRGWKFEDNHTKRGFSFNLDGEYGSDKRDRIFLPVKDIVPVSLVLPRGQFGVVLKGDGSSIVIPMKDDTPRCLLFVGIQGQARQGVNYRNTTGNVLYAVSAGSNVDLFTQAVVLLETDQSIELFSTSKELDYSHLYIWNGRDIETCFSAN